LFLLKHKKRHSEDLGDGQSNGRPEGIGEKGMGTPLYNYGLMPGGGAAYGMPPGYGMPGMAAMYNHGMAPDPNCDPYGGQGWYNRMVDRYSQCFVDYFGAYPDPITTIELVTGAGPFIQPLVRDPNAFYGSPIMDNPIWGLGPVPSFMPAPYGVVNPPPSAFEFTPQPTWAGWGYSWSPA
jgi:hypothetical protein